MSKEHEDWLDSPDCRLRMVLISADRLERLTKIQAPRCIILQEMEILQKRLDHAIVTVELEPEWKPGKDICPE